jgi:hypothetical protein
VEIIIRKNIVEGCGSGCGDGHERHYQELVECGGGGEQKNVGLEDERSPLAFKNV